MIETPNLPGKLLVVEDNQVNRLLLVKSLELRGHQASSVENGREALEALRRESFDLVLLDIEMPEMSGYEVLEVMMSDPLLRNIPVIVVSASEELSSVVKCIEMGAEDYLTKPPNPVLLRARVNACLEKKRLRDQQRKLFRTFTTVEVADELLAKGFELGGKHVRASAMFCDVRDFTAIAESRDPSETIDLLNELFAIMFGAISDHGGIVNQIQGDGLMAIFGAPIPQPNHAEQAVRAAIEIVQRIEQFNADNLKSARPYPQLTIGIGIATGKMVAGYVGTRERATYTCIGDSVNLAARIENHTKAVKKSILVDEFTRETLPPEIKTTSLGEEVFKGKTQPIHIYAVD
jgi:class 3 adenylate cyclase